MSISKIEANNDYYPPCPHCAIEIEEDEDPTYETEDVFVYMYRRGKCPWCRRKYRWTEIYKWDETFYDYEEV